MEKLPVVWWDGYVQRHTLTLSYWVTMAIWSVHCCHIVFSAACTHVTAVSVCQLWTRHYMRLSWTGWRLAVVIPRTSVGFTTLTTTEHTDKTANDKQFELESMNYPDEKPCHLSRHGVISQSVLDMKCTEYFGLCPVQSVVVLLSAVRFAQPRPWNEALKYLQFIRNQHATSLCVITRGGGGVVWVSSPRQVVCPTGRTFVLVGHLRD